MKSYWFYLKFKFLWKNKGDHEEKIEDWVIEKGSAVIETGNLWQGGFGYDMWHRSKYTKDSGDNPFSSYMLNKKWTLEEEFNSHMMQFQQVTVSEILLLH